MADLKFITMTQLFWDTLEKHRGHSRYPDIRAKIAWCVERKIENRSFRTNSDYPFTSNNKNLEGIWHVKLSVNPDVVMFYTISSDTLNLAMIGSHHDYPHQGKHSQKADAFGRKLKTAVDRGHVASPAWGRIKWNAPSDIANCFELEETTIDHLEAIMDELRQELEDAPIYRRVHGAELEDASLETIDAWLNETDRALQAVEAAQERVRRIERGREAGRSPISAFVPKVG
ncbi:hypothetical protein GOB57_22015 [Sinorhizobium meliloti]|nr:hypothetical protein [Sinorhizobium meliloti]